MLNTDVQKKTITYVMAAIVIAFLALGPQWTFSWQIRDVCFNPMSKQVKDTFMIQPDAVWDMTERQNIPRGAWGVPSTIAFINPKIDEFEAELLSNDFEGYAINYTKFSESNILEKNQLVEIPGSIIFQYHSWISQIFAPGSRTVSIPIYINNNKFISASENLAPWLQTLIKESHCYQ